MRMDLSHASGRNRFNNRPPTSRSRQETTGTWCACRAAAHACFLVAFDGVLRLSIFGCGLDLPVYVAGRVRGSPPPPSRHFGRVLRLSCHVSAGNSHQPRSGPPPTAVGGKRQMRRPPALLPGLFGDAIAGLLVGMLSALRATRKAGPPGVGEG
jgi:hypothetical protein